MAKKLTVYGAFRNGTTVYCDIFGVFAVRKGMDDLWNGLFTDPAFPGHQNRNIRWGHLNGLFYGTVERYIIANKLKSLFYGLNTFHFMSFLRKQRSCCFVFGFRIMYGMTKSC